MIKILSLRKMLIPTLFVLFAISLVLFSSSNLSAAQKGLELWATSIIPSLFPFFVATELLSYTNIIQFIGKCFNRIMKPLFNICGEGAFAFIMGIISGYPVGAKIVCNLRKSNLCSKEDCERLLAFTNNSGPLFILGTIGIKMFGNSMIGLLLLFTHILACLSVGICFRFWKYSNSCKFTVSHSNNYSLKNRVHLSNLGEILSNSISSSISTILNIGGFIVIFSVIISILKHYNFMIIFTPCLKFLHISPEIVESFILGIVEITNGIFALSTFHIQKLSILIVLTAFLLGCGGISILLQVWSIVSKTDLSIKPYIIGKFLHGCFAAFYTFLFILFFPIFQFDL